MKNSKKTAYFYIGIIILVLMFAMLVFQIHSYNAQINMYVESYGYDEAYVKEMVPFFETMMPDISNVITSYGLLSIIAFGINSVLNALKNDAYVVENFDAEKFVKTVADPDGDGKTVFEEAKEGAKVILDKAEDKLEEVKDKVEDKIDEIKEEVKEEIND